MASKLFPPSLDSPNSDPGSQTVSRSPQDQSPHQEAPRTEEVPAGGGPAEPHQAESGKAKAAKIAALIASLTPEQRAKALGGDNRGRAAPPDFKALASALTAAVRLYFSFKSGALLKTVCTESTDIEGDLAEVLSTGYALVQSFRP
jgi:hypothetical protein